MSLMLTQRYIDGVVLALDLHREQVRKGTNTPYASHLLSVSALALEYGADEDEAIAALLHDAGEDQGGMATIETIRHRFGDRVADIVAACSDSLTDARLPWRQRKERYLEHLATADKSVALVSGCDKLHNARSILSDIHRIGDAVWERFTGDRDGVLWYYTMLCDSLARSHSPAVSELRRVMTDIRRVIGSQSQ